MSEELKPGWLKRAAESDSLNQCPECGAFQVGRASLPADSGLVDRTRELEEALKVAVEALEWLAEYIHTYCIIVHPRETRLERTPEDTILERIETALTRINQLQEKK